MKKGLFKIAAVALLLTACSGDNVAGGASGDAGVVAVKDWEVAGVSQKGPFVTGSAVTVQELDGVTLKQTGKSFKGSIKSDKGDFAIKDINLQSQYAILEASGYYRDEISGKKSSGTVTLRALTDLSNRKTVNINLLTHLEYERVMYLVTEKKKSIAEAKEQAEKEILSSFGIDGDFAESEDLNIFESGDGNAALLAVSVLMQSDVDVAGLTERMGEFSIALAEGGSWDDADTKTAIADWACDVDLKGTLANIRRNVENWKYADSVPAFEKYVTNFWWNNYGLGVCNAKRENETKRNVNKLSKLYNEYFVCEKGRWVIPGDGPESSSSTGHGDEVSSSSESGEPVFGTLTDARDGKVYKTVKLGSQEWMAENLNYAAEGSHCYEDKEENCEKYGRLYTWEVALDTLNRGCGDNFSGCRLRNDFHPRQGVCPDGWHLPEHSEWDTLFVFATAHSENENVGSSLQAYNWDDYNEVLHASDRYGFNIIPAGISFQDEYADIGKSTEFWTSSIEKTDWITYATISPVTLRFSKNYPSYTVYLVNIARAVSVRCVKGEGGKRNGYNFNSLRFDELSEDFEFAAEYLSSKSLEAWDDDSLTTVWTAHHKTDTAWVQMETFSTFLMDQSKEDAAGDSLEVFRKVLLENGFTYVKSDTVAENAYDTEEYSDHIVTKNGIILRHLYEKETEMAKYEVDVHVGAGMRAASAMAGNTLNIFVYGYSIIIHTQYKKK